jgi:hypothetical protein
LARRRRTSIVTGAAAMLTHVSLPLPWDAFGLPSPLAGSSTTLVEGPPGWRWTTPPPIEVGESPPASGSSEPGWDVDHVVLLVPDMHDLNTGMRSVGLRPRLTMQVSGRTTSFFRVGTVLEVVESPVRAAALYGVALVTEEPLETVSLRWRAMGIEVGDIRPAIQPGRRIFTVGAVEAGLAVISPDRSVG